MNRRLSQSKIKNDPAGRIPLIVNVKGMFEYRGINSNGRAPA